LDKKKGTYNAENGKENYTPTWGKIEKAIKKIKGRGGESVRRGGIPLKGERERFRKPVLYSRKISKRCFSTTKK